MHDPLVSYERILFEALGKEIRIKDARLIAAGTMNQGTGLITGSGNFFLKTNHLEDSDIFLKEKQGLDVMRGATSLQVPEVVHWGRLEDTNFLLLEWIPSANRSTSYWEVLAEGLAELHMCNAAEFGWDTANYISILPQRNKRQAAWYMFFIEERLEPMIQRALFHGLIDGAFLEQFRRIYPKIAGIFPKELPAFLHGDLWQGNVLVNGSGAPALIDPAVYFGHREMDLAFSKLFGGFDEDFYEAYDQVFPLEPGFDERVEVYNLYPLLVHLNLFGSGYLAGIKKTVRRFQ
jgi:fructosamine-3-kinase